MKFFVRILRTVSTAQGHHEARKIAPDLEARRAHRIRHDVHQQGIARHEHMSARHRHAQRRGSEREAVDMPICLEVYRIMHEARPVRDALQALMSREVRSEAE